MNLILFLPETILCALIFFLLCLTLAKNEPGENMLSVLMFCSAVTLLGASLFTANYSGVAFGSTYQIDFFSQGFKCILSLCFLFTCLFSERLISIRSGRRVEYYLFLCTATLGMVMMTSSADLLTLYISLELSSYSLYLLTSLGQGKNSPEATVKYLIFGAATSGLMLWGMSLVTGLAGTTSLPVISSHLGTLSGQPAFALALALVSFAFLFKLSAFPMHFWAPDIYECAPTPVTTFIATASKAAAVAILIRFMMWTGASLPFVAILSALAFISMTLGNTVALVQKDVKRLLAYSSIAQAGYILVGLLSGTLEGYSSSFFYAGAYVLMNTGAFLVTAVIANNEGDDNPQISHFDGLAERSPFMALLLLLSLLSLAGIPPLAGFTGKWILFSAAMEKGHWFLVLWGVLNSVVSLFYYLTLVKHAYLEKPKHNTPLIIGFRMKALGLFIFCALILAGLFPNVLITFAQVAIRG